jgi:cation diffusion facilitator family transporter
MSTVPVVMESGSIPGAAQLLCAVSWLIVGSALVLISAAILYVDDAIMLFWLGTCVNIILSVAKIALARVAEHQKALMADALHGLGDTVAQVVTALAYAEAARPPDREHPWGHGKIEALGAVVAACIILYIAASLAWDCLTSIASMAQPFHHNGGEDRDIPGTSTRKGFLVRHSAIGITVASVMLKEALFRATMVVGQRTQSNLVIATAWNHRGDSMASGVALASQVGASFGQHYLDSVGGGLVASMLGHSAYDTVYHSLNDLLDHNAASGEDTWSRCGRDALSESIVKVRGVRSHTLRARRSGPHCVVDLAIVVDARISASAASMIAEAVHDRVIADFRPYVTDVLVHVDPDGSPQSHRLETHSETAPAPAERSTLPEKVEAQIRAALLSLADERPDLPRIAEVTELQTYYQTAIEAATPGGASLGENLPFYVDVKADVRLAGSDVTLRSATEVARAARVRVLAALPGMARTVDIDLELDEMTAAKQGGVSGFESHGLAPAVCISCERAIVAHVDRWKHGHWDPCPTPSPTVGNFGESKSRSQRLQQVTLIWERGHESKQAGGPLVATQVLGGAVATRPLQRSVTL